MPVYIGSRKAKQLYIGGRKVKKGYAGSRLFYSAGSIVTYVVDSGVSYSEEVDEGDSVLSPKTFTPSKTGWTFVGWRQDTSASGSVLSSLIMGDKPVTLYAVFRQTVTVTYYNGNTTASSTAGYRYYNNGNISNPAFTLTPASLSGWTFRGWATSSAATASIIYSSISGEVFTSDITLYAVYYQGILLSYNGNGNTGGSVEVQTGLRWFNTGNISNPTFELRVNGFTRTGYTFRKWAMGSTGGTQYSPGTAVTLSQNTTMYALWTFTGSGGETGGGSVSATGTSSVELNFSGAEGGKHLSGTLYLESAALGKRLTATVRYTISNGIFNAVSGQKASITCGGTDIYSYSYGDTKGDYSDTKQITFTASSTTLTLKIGADKAQDPNQGTQWCRGTISISDIKYA